MLFYARESGAKTLEEITSLNLSGKNLLTVEDLSFLKKMTNLKFLDISDNVDMYKPREMLEMEAKKRAEGSADPTQFDFKDNKHHRDVLLHNLPTVEHLICDIMLEAYILDTRPFRKYMPNLKTINRVPIEIKDLAERTMEKRILDTMNKMWRYVQSYRLVKPGAMDEEPTFYINDEVGNAISHNDQYNSKLAPIIYSPNCDITDPDTTTYSLLWLTEGVKKNHFIYRDYL